MHQNFNETMNYEELLETRDARKTNKIRLPYGFFYKRLIDGKYSNFVEFHDELADNILFNECVRRQCDALGSVKNKHQLHFTPNQEDEGIYALAVEPGNYITFEQLLNDSPSVVARKDFLESTIRDLVEITIKREKNNLAKTYEETAKANALKAVGDALRKDGFVNLNEDKLANGEYDNQEVEIALPENPNKSQSSDPFFDGATPMGTTTTMISIIPLFEYNGPDKKNKKELKKVKVREALETLVEAEVAKHVDKGLIIADILRKIEQKGVVFLDEIDKLISHKEAQSRGEVSREGVQRDLLPIIEGTMVQTKHGTVKTDHILFIAAGAFHDNKVSDLMPELQGRFPVQVELKSLTVDDFEHILTDLKYNLLEQQKTLLKVDGINIVFEPDGVRAIAELAHRMNSELENTGARRLFSVIEKVTEDISYNGKSGSEAVIDKKYVEKTTADIFDKKVNVRKYLI